MENNFKEILIEMINKIKGIKKLESIYNEIKQNKDLYDFIIKNTSFLNIYNVKFSQKLYHIVYNLYESPKCLDKNCSNIVKFRSFKRGYYKYCCKICAANNNKTEQSKKQLKQTCLDKYGVPHYSQTKEFHNKYEQTCLDKYGVSHYSQTKEYHNKYEQTCLDKYDCINVFQVEEFKEKSKLKINEKYGCDNVFQSIIIKKQTKCGDSE